ncbi:MAG: 7TM diverse intracellular signaling domain-containing protein [Bacteroidota bacterium]
MTLSKKTIPFFIFLFAFVFLRNVAIAQVIRINEDIYKQQNISNSISVYEDPSGKLSLAQVIDKQGFKLITEKIANFGLTSSTVWLKVQIANPQKYKDIFLEIKNPTFDRVELFMPQQNGQFRSHISGMAVDVKKREVHHQNPIFRLFPTSNDTTTYFLSVRSSNPLTLPIYLGSFKSTLSSITLGDSIFSLYIGLIITMFLYNIFIYFTVRDKSYLFYVIYILSVGFTQMSLLGYSQIFLWGDNLLLNIQGIVLSIVLVGITSVLFAAEFLHVRQYSKQVTYYLNFLILLYCVGLLISFIGYPIQAQMMLQILTIIVSLSLITTGIVVYRKNYRPALYFVISWSCFLLGVIIFIMKDIGILVSSFFTNNAILIGSGLEAVLLSFALADKINIFKKEKEESQAEALRVLTENEKLVREQNVVLEIKVKERTEELENTNATLNTTLVDLKEAQSQLVDSEKMAGLGQLTAGIAHEINNPINFVTSNIKPLELDIKELNEVIDMYDKLDTTANLEEQLAAIQVFKRRIDIHFVRDEIKSLLSGIDEGAKRTAEIIRSLKNFSRLDENDTKPVDLNEGLDSTLVLIRSTFPGNLKIIKEYSPIPPVECMPGKINQVFMNLITNAIHAVKSKEEQGEEEFITIKTWQEDEFVKISIKDSGVGMPESIKQKIFEPFFTTKDVGEGTGLGLSIVFRIIENHHGTIDVITNVNEGTEFIIILPINSK